MQLDVSGKVTDVEKNRPARFRCHVNPNFFTQSARVTVNNVLVEGEQFPRCLTVVHTKALSYDVPCTEEENKYRRMSCYLHVVDDPLLYNRKCEVVPWRGICCAVASTVHTPAPCTVCMHGIITVELLQVLHWYSLSSLFLPPCVFFCAKSLNSVHALIHLISNKLNGSTDRGRPSARSMHLNVYLRPQLLVAYELLQVLHRTCHRVSPFRRISKHLCSYPGARRS